jgi:hypothetical protein
MAPAPTTRIRIVGLLYFSVMPGHSSLFCADYVNLPAMPGIHVFLDHVHTK